MFGVRGRPVSMRQLYYCGSQWGFFLQMGSCPTVWKLCAGFVSFLHVQKEKEHLFIVNLLPFFCSCFTESTTNMEFSRFRPAERGSEKPGLVFIRGSKLLWREISLVKLQHDYFLFFLSRDILLENWCYNSKKAPGNVVSKHIIPAMND